MSANTSFKLFPFSKLAQQISMDAKWLHYIHTLAGYICENIFSKCIWRLLHKYMTYFRGCFPCCWKFACCLVEYLNSLSLLFSANRNRLKCCKHGCKTGDLTWPHTVNQSDILTVSAADVAFQTWVYFVPTADVSLSIQCIFCWSIKITLSQSFRLFPIFTGVIFPDIAHHIS